MIFLSTFPPFGPKRIKLLSRYFKSSKRIWNASKKDLLDVGLSEQLVNKFSNHKQSFQEDIYLKRLSELGIKTTTLHDPDYPRNLREIDDAPSVLYYFGEILPSDKNSVAIVGTRKMTYYGKDVTQKFASELASWGITIVSGLARGVDTMAHATALAAGGRTIAVVGSGLDKIYPPENINLSKKIAAGFGAIVSEYPLGYPALPNNFAFRNRIISGLSRAILVTEGMKKSGTFYTVKAALEQGRTVFAVPGPINSLLSEGPNYLIKEGSTPALSPKDILDELEIEINQSQALSLCPEKSEEEILNFLDSPCHIDDISRICKLSIAELSGKLTVMELKGFVKNLGGGIYKKIF